MRLSAVSMCVSIQYYFIPCAHANSSGFLLISQLTLPPPGWYFMLSVEPILERTFFRSGSGVLVGRTFRGARGTGGFFSRGVCLGTGGLVMREGRVVGVPLVAAVLLAESGVRVVLGVVLTAKQNANHCSSKQHNPGGLIQRSQTDQSCCHWPHECFFSLSHQKSAKPSSKWQGFRLLCTQRCREELKVLSVWCFQTGLCE